MNPFLNGLDADTVSVGTSSTPLTSRAGARSPVAVPAKTRLPGAKITSGLSVRASTTTSPRIPCALRISPTIAYSDAGIVGEPAALGGRFVGSFAERNRFSLALDTESLLVTLPENTGAPKERAHGVGGLSAEVEPMVCSCLVDLQRALSLSGS